MRQSPASIKGVVFDLDGVLVHTDRLHFLAWSRLAKEEGIPFTEEDNKALRGVSRIDSLNMILRKGHREATDEEKAEMCDRKNSYYRGYLAGLSPKDVAPEVTETLKTLKERGYPLAVGSSSKNTPFILEKTDLGKWFDAVVDGTMITKGKPDPEVFLLAAERIKLPSKECLVVEDAPAGVLAGKNGGFLTAGILEAKDDPNTDFPINSLVDLLGILP
jgi:beta-phosphoglucomutase